MLELEWFENRGSYEATVKDRPVLTVIKGRFYDIQSDQKAKLFLVFADGKMQELFRKFYLCPYFQKIEDVRKKVGDFFRDNPKLLETV